MDKLSCFARFVCTLVPPHPMPWLRLHEITLPLSRCLTLSCTPPLMALSFSVFWFCALSTRPPQGSYRTPRFSTQEEFRLSDVPDFMSPPVPSYPADCIHVVSSCRFAFHPSTPGIVQNALILNSENGDVSLTSRGQWNQTRNEETIVVNVTRTDQPNCEYTK